MTGKDIKECENIAERYADCDEFVCSKCGIHLMEWVEVRLMKIMMKHIASMNLNIAQIVGQK